jgi:putative transcriptional regulator
MGFDGMSPAAIATLLGQRIKQARLNENLTQMDLAKKAGVSRTAITYVEQGKSTLETIIAVLMALGLTEQLDLFVPEPSISPIQFSKLQGKQRQRASSKSNDDYQLKDDTSEKDDSAW